MGSEKEKKNQQLDIFEISNINDIAKIDNRVVTENFAKFSKGWGAFDLDWWTIAMSQPVGHDDQYIAIPTEKVKSIFLKNKHTHESLKDFVRRSNKSLSKFLDIKIDFEQENKDKLAIITAHIFDASFINTDYKTMLKINETSRPVFNQFKSWTRFPVSTMASLHTAYSKRLFIYLKQWRTVGKVSFTLEEFRNNLDVPESYKPGSIDQKIIMPALEDLAPYFYQLKLEKTYAKAKRGRKLSGYVFSFRPEPKEKKDVGLSKKIEDWFAIYSIVDNRYLSQEHKFRAVDRYRNVRLGSTKKYYSKHHPQTIFLDPTNKEDRKYTIAALNTLSITSLQTIAIAYEELLKKGKLKEWDFEDLYNIEKSLFCKQVNLMIETSNAKDPYKPSEKIHTIASRLISKIDIDKFEQNKIDMEIKIIIRKEFGSFVRVEDHRPLEVKAMSKDE